ncbi:ABC transporter permease [Thermocatellispora tengchongensis]|uniref:ABC transporter permease n=1 Tax=Thermocatellispora tengchongensis TaxID=1073253 RepID=UPI00363A5299
MVRGGRHPGHPAARPRDRPVGAGRLRGRGPLPRLRRPPHQDLRAVHGRVGGGRARRAAAYGEPGEPGGGGRQPALRRAGRQGRRRGRVHQPAARPGRGRAAGRRRGRGQHDGDLGAGAAQEIGLRRSLGATRGQVRVQFLAESLLLSALGGVAGGVLGAAATIAYATSKDWPAVVPPWAFGGAVGATLVIGTLAGLYPAMRAARLSPTEALATT